MNRNYEDKLQEIIRVFGNNDILSNIIIIGSWATYFYVKTFDGFVPSIRTLDVDCYIPRTKNISVKKSVPESLKPINFDQIFDSGIEIEFLTKLKRDNCQIVKVDSMGVNAEQLGNLNIFDKGYIEVDFEGYTVKVASPAAYIMQKILISHKRTEEKYNKDLESIQLVLKEVKKDKNHLSEYESLINSLGKRTKKRYNKYITDNNLEL